MAQGEKVSNYLSILWVSQQPPELQQINLDFSVNRSSISACPIPAHLQIEVNLAFPNIRCLSDIQGLASVVPWSCFHAQQNAFRRSCWCLLF